MAVHWLMSLCGSRRNETLALCTLNHGSQRQNELTARSVLGLLRQTTNLHFRGSLTMKPPLARLFCTCATALLVSAPYATRGGELNLDFSGDQPFWINGPGYVDWIGGVDDGPCLKLTDGGFFQNTWAFIFDLDFEPTTAFNAKFKMLMGGATAPADG